MVLVPQMGSQYWTIFIPRIALTNRDMSPCWPLLNAILVRFPHSQNGFYLGNVWWVTSGSSDRPLLIIYQNVLSVHIMVSYYDFTWHKLSGVSKFGDWDTKNIITMMVKLPQKSPLDTYKPWNVLLWLFSEFIMNVGDLSTPFSRGWSVGTAVGSDGHVSCYLMNVSNCLD